MKYTHKHTVSTKCSIGLLLYSTCSSIMSLVCGRSAVFSLVYCLTRDTMGDHWMHWIWTSLCALSDSGSYWRHIFTSNTPKLKTSIFGECWLGKQASGAVYTGLPGPTVVTSWSWLTHSQTPLLTSHYEGAPVAHCHCWCHGGGLPLASCAGWLAWAQWESLADDYPLLWLLWTEEGLDGEAWLQLSFLEWTVEYCNWKGSLGKDNLLPLGARETWQF